jgi:hypothetical protein
VDERRGISDIAFGEIVEFETQSLDAVDDDISDIGSLDGLGSGIDAP